MSGVGGEQGRVGTADPLSVADLLAPVDSADSVADPQARTPFLIKHYFEGGTGAGGGTDDC